MQQNEFFALGLGLTLPWKLIDQRLDMDKNPNELHLRIKAERGSLYACPDCGKMCKAHDFRQKGGKPALDFVKLLYIPDYSIVVDNR
jgi:hypothetical protein